jgi:Ca2+-dependent lipid-binding protein
VRLRIRIISGQHLPKAPGNPEIVDPYIEIKISGLPQDKAMFTTRSIHNNGFNPMWDEVFEVRVRCPELAIMYLRVKDYAHSGTDMPLAHFAIPVTAISPGYGHIQLQDLKGVSLQPSTLFVQVNVTPYSDP